MSKDRGDGGWDLAKADMGWWRYALQPALGSGIAAPECTGLHTMRSVRNDGSDF